jgi:predicted aldo/keto reductase-like oxidoreductase
MINRENLKTPEHIEINLNTRVYDILMEYGDIAEVPDKFLKMVQNAVKTNNKSGGNNSEPQHS